MSPFESESYISTPIHETTTSISNVINILREDISIEDLDENSSSYLENKMKRLISISSSSIRKQRDISTYENTTNTATRSMKFPCISIIEVQQISVTPQQMRFDQYMKILNEMETEKKISSDDYFDICRAFMKGLENYSILFADMKPDFRVK